MKPKHECVRKLQRKQKIRKKENKKYKENGESHKYNELVSNYKVEFRPTNISKRHWNDVEYYWICIELCIKIHRDVSNSTRIEYLFRVMKCIESHQIYIDISISYQAFVKLFYKLT